jgi:hypothetical protein
MKYEAFLADPLSAVRIHAQFLQVDLPESALQQICDASTAPATEPRSTRAHPLTLMLSRAARRIGLELKLHDENTLLHPDHISATGGAPGTWRTALTAQELDVVYEIGGRWLMRHGYEI